MQIIVNSATKVYRFLSNPESGFTRVSFSCPCIVTLNMLPGFLHAVRDEARYTFI